MAKNEIFSKLPEKANYIKLSQYKDGEEFTATDVYINPQSKYGIQTGFIVDGAILTLPKRYNDYVQSIADDLGAMQELSEGVTYKVVVTPGSTRNSYDIAVV